MDMKKMIIGTLVACVLAISTTTANAAVATRKAAVKVVQKAKPIVSSVSKKVTSFLWRNKTGIAVGATTTAVIMKPEAIVKGVLGFAASPFFLYLLLAGLVIVGGRYLLHRIGIWRILPLLVLGLLLSCGVAEAGVMDWTSSPAMQCAVPVKPVMDILMLVVLVITLFV